MKNGPFLPSFFIALSIPFCGLPRVDLTCTILMDAWVVSSSFAMTNNVAINNFLCGRFVVQVHVHVQVHGYNTFLELRPSDQLVNTYTRNKYLCKLSFREVFTICKDIIINLLELKYFSKTQGILLVMRGEENMHSESSKVVWQGRKGNK